MRTLADAQKLLEGDNILFVSYDKDGEAPYITLTFKNNTNYIRNIFAMRSMQYSIEITKDNDDLSLTISGKKELFDDFCELDFSNDIDDKEFDEIINYIFLFDKIRLSTYYDGVYYYYYILDNKYSIVLNYFGFENTITYLRYRTVNNDIFYEIMKDVIKNTKIYKSYVYDVYDEFDIASTKKNAYIEDIKNVFYPQKEKKITILFIDNKAHVLIGNNDFVYDKNSFVMFMLPEVLEIYSKTFDEKENEEINNCVGKCFYTLTSKNGSFIKILNIDEDKLDANVRYLNEQIEKKDLKEKREMNVKFNRDGNVSYGYVNVFIVSMVILGVGFITFFLTLILFKFYMR